MTVNRILEKVDSLLHQSVTIRVDDELLMRMFHLDDALQLFELTDSNRAHLREWLPWVDSNQSVHDTRRFIQTIIDQHRANEGFQCGIWFKEQLAGVIGFHKVDWMNKNVEIGYWLAEQYEKKGLMTRACKALVDYAFHEYKLKRVQIRCATGNIKSCGIPERLGFRKEGLALQAEYLYGRFVDLIIYGMTDVEWLGIQDTQSGKVHPSPADRSDVETVDGIIRALYECVTFPPAGAPDFRRLRSLCHIGAVFVPPKANDMDNAPVLYIEEFIARSKVHIENSELKNKGFHEREVTRRTELFGNIAHILSTYETRYSANDTSPMARGINSIQLLRDANRWSILSVAWESERPGNPIPNEFLSAS